MKGKKRPTFCEQGCETHKPVSFPVSSHRCGLCRRKPVGWLTHLAAGNVPTSQNHERDVGVGHAKISLSSFVQYVFVIADPVYQTSILGIGIVVA